MDSDSDIDEQMYQLYVDKFTNNISICNTHDITQICEYCEKYYLEWYI